MKQSYPGFCYISIEFCIYIEIYILRPLAGSVVHTSIYVQSYLNKINKWHLVAILLINGQIIHLLRKWKVL